MCKRAFLILTGILALNGCTTTPGANALHDREWRLASVEGIPSVPGGEAAPTIRFGSDGRLGGNTGCNSAGATYTAEGDRLTIGAIMATKRACLEAARNELERAYLDALGRTRRFRVTGNELELLDDGGTVLARFV